MCLQPGSRYVHDLQPAQGISRIVGHKIGAKSAASELRVGRPQIGAHGASFDRNTYCGLYGAPGTVSLTEFQDFGIYTHTSDSTRMEGL